MVRYLGVEVDDAIEPRRRSKSDGDATPSKPDIVGVVLSAVDYSLADGSFWDKATIAGKTPATQFDDCKVLV